MHSEKFFKESRLPFVECRISRSSSRQFKAHMHRAFSIGAVDRGQARYQVDDRQIDLPEGCLALINPETLHACNTFEQRQ